MSPSCRKVAALFSGASETATLFEVEESLADELGMSRRSFEMALVSLERAELIVWHRRKRGQAARYPYHRIEVLDRAGLAEVAS